MSNLYKVMFVVFVFFSVFNFASAVTINSNTLNAGGDTLKSGLIGWWTFDGVDLVSNVADKSSGGNHGSMSGFTSTSSAKVVGKLGQALTFDGVDDYVTTADINAMDGLSTYTISVWAKPKIVTTNKEIVAKWSTFGMFVQSGTSVAGRVAFGFNGSNFVSTTNSVLSAGKWVHIVGVFNNAAGTGKHKIYINGVSQALTDNASPDTVTNTGSNTASFTIGRLDATGRYWNGAIDDVRVYNRVLNDSEIVKLYNQGGSKLNSQTGNAGGDTLKSGLVGHWTFDGADLVSNVADKSGNGMTGYLVNMATSTAKVFGKLGQALKFDGVDDYVTVPDHSSFNTSGNFTTSVWFKAPNINQTAPIVGRRLGIAPYTQWNMIINGDDCLNGSLGKKICFFIAESYPTTYRSFRTTNEVVDGKWHNVVMVSNRTAGTFKAYVDGAEVSVTTELSSGSYPNPDVAQPFMMGQINSPLHLNGTIDDVRYYNRPLSVSEVKQLYNLGGSKLNSQTGNAGGDTLKSGLVGYWTFDGVDLVSNVIDKSGNGNHGNMSGFTSTTTAKAVGKLGQALKFDGVNDYIQGTNLGFSGNVTTSISAWVKFLGANDGNFPAIIDLTSTTGSNTGLSFTVKDNKPAFDIWVNRFRATSALSTGVWHHIVLTKTPGLLSSTAKIYVNGVEVAGAVEGSDATPNVTSGSFNIGRLSGTGLYFNGVVDDIRVYNRALSVSEVKRLYNTGR